MCSSWSECELEREREEKKEGERETEERQVREREREKERERICAPKSVKNPRSLVQNVPFFANRSLMGTLLVTI